MKAENREVDTVCLCLGFSEDVLSLLVLCQQLPIRLYQFLILLLCQQ